jgi:hypothetical protein
MQKPVDDSIWDTIKVVFRLICEFLLNSSVVLFYVTDTVFILLLYCLPVHLL